MKYATCNILFCIVAVILHTGCSTIINNGRPSGIRVTSNPPGAQIFVDNVLAGITPADIDISGSSRKVSVDVRKEGYATATAKVEKHTDPWVWGNAPFVIFPIAAAVGVGIDAYSGKWYRYEPNTIDVVLEATHQTNMPSPTPTPPIIQPAKTEDTITNAPTDLPANEHHASPKIKPASLQTPKPDLHPGSAPESISADENDSLLDQFLKGQQQ